MNDVSQNTNVYAATGNNFSGRSEYLKNECRSHSRNIYIGEIPSNYLSGVSPTVKNELDLFSSRTSINTLSSVTDLIKSLNYDRLYHSNPFLLSGGEQVLLTVLSGILVEPDLLAVDTAMEQLSDEWKAQLFNLIQQKLVQQKLLISDNRMMEYKIPYMDVIVSQGNKEYEKTFEKPIFVDHNNLTGSESVSINNLWFSYERKNQILKGINIELKPGNVYFLNGINGSGKSTLAKILSGILKVENGNILINNKLYNPYKIPGMIFGYCFQNPDEQLFSSNVADEILKSAEDETDEYIERREVFLKMFGLGNLRDLHPAELPFVLRKRIALAATLAYDRPWYVIDEPTIGQDDSFIHFLSVLFKYYASIGKGIILISHSQTFINMFQSKVLYLDKGFLNSN